MGFLSILRFLLGTFIFVLSICMPIEGSTAPEEGVSKENIEGHFKKIMVGFLSDLEIDTKKRRQVDSILERVKKNHPEILYHARRSHANCKENLTYAKEPGERALELFTCPGTLSKFLKETTGYDYRTYHTYHRELGDKDFEFYGGCYCRWPISLIKVKECDFCNLKQEAGRQKRFVEGLLKATIAHELAHAMIDWLALSRNNMTPLEHAKLYWYKLKEIFKWSGQSSYENRRTEEYLADELACVLLDKTSVLDMLSFAYTAAATEAGIVKLIAEVKYNAKWWIKWIPSNTIRLKLIKFLVNAGNWRNAHPDTLERIAVTVPGYAVVCAQAGIPWNSFKQQFIKSSERTINYSANNFFEAIQRTKKLTDGTPLSEDRYNSVMKVYQVWLALKKIQLNCLVDKQQFLYQREYQRALERKRRETPAFGDYTSPEDRI